MNRLLIAKILGLILIIESFFMVPSLILAISMGDGSSKAFILTIVLLLIVGGISYTANPKQKTLVPADGLVIVTYAWILVSLFGALPLMMGANMTFPDAFFEIVSGFTTTGASVISNIESFPKSIVLWRSVTHWIGGMGILVFTVSLVPKLGVGGFQIFKRESPGPVKGKIDPKTSDTAKKLYIIYIVITICLFICLVLAGMNVFDAVVDTLGVVGTGGFSSKNNSLMDGSTPVIFIMSLFMLMCGTNFSIYYSLFKRRFKEVFINEELRLYLFVTFLAISLISIDLYYNNFGSPFNVFKNATFQVTSIQSTSGFVSSDFDLWPSFSKYILFMLMFMGSCAGSTAGGLKVIRIVVLLKSIKREIKRVIHPKAILPISINGRLLSEELVQGINGFFGVYMLVFVFSVGLITLTGEDFVTSMSSVVTMLSNVGPGLGHVGPTKNFQYFNDFYKLYFSFLMLLGRLEFFTVLAIFSRKNYLREKVLK